MIEQYLPNNNENSYNAILQNFSHLNQPNTNERITVLLKILQQHLNTALQQG
jgi:hypothetical protein